MKTFTKIPPKISVPLFYTVTTLVLFVRFILGTITGTFLFFLAMYMYLKYFGELKPFSWSELIYWINGLEKEYKLAILSSSVTIVGFVVAFHTATINWKSQLRAQLKNQVSSEVEDFFAQISRDITTARLYAELLIKTVNEIQSGCSINEAHFKLQYINQQSNIFLATRERLILYSIEIHRLLGRNYNVLSTGWKLIDNLQSATDAFMQITDKMWLSIPVIDVNNPNHIQLFMKNVNVVQYSDFIKVCKDNYNTINMLSGNVRGYLIAPVVGFNLFAFLNLFKIKGKFRETIEEYYHKTKNNG